jgi:hypothetical protein
MNAKQRMYQRIEKHGNDLKRIFNLDMDAIKLSKKVHGLEVKAARIALDYCNGYIDMDVKEKGEEAILKALDKVLNFTVQNIPVFFNGDPRGYTLKIDDEYVRVNQLDIYRDWGGYGILSPEFDGKE